MMLRDSKADIAELANKEQNQVTIKYTYNTGVEVSKDRTCDQLF